MTMRWRPGLLAFLVAIAFVPGISGAATTPRWCVLLIGVPGLLLCAKPRLSWRAVPFLCFCAWMLATAPFSAAGYDAAFGAGKIALGFLIFLLGASLDDLRTSYFGFALGIVLGLPFGTFTPHTEVMGEAAVAVAAALAAQGSWISVSWLTAALAISRGRGALLAFVAVATWMLWKKSKPLAVLFVAAGLYAVFLALRLGNLGSVTERIELWTDTVHALNMLGHGLGSYYVQFPQFADQIDTLFARPEHAHNDLLEIAFEGGIVGAILFVASLGTLLARRGCGSEKQLVCAIAVIGCFGFPLALPATFFLTMLALGRLARRDFDIGDDAQCGAPLCGERAHC